MALTTLNLSGHDTPAARQQAVRRPSTDCPQCGAKKGARERAGGFGGGPNHELCGYCGYEFPENGGTR